MWKYFEVAFIVAIVAIAAAIDAAISNTPMRVHDWLTSFLLWLIYFGVRDVRKQVEGGSQ